MSVALQANTELAGRCNTSSAPYESDNKALLRNKSHYLQFWRNRRPAVVPLTCNTSRDRIDIFSRRIHHYVWSTTQVKVVVVLTCTACGLLTVGIFLPAGVGSDA